MIDYQPGDVVVQRMWGGWHRDVYVEEHTIHNGHPAFTGRIVEETCDGDLAMKGRVWGYQAQIIRNLGPTVYNTELDRVFVYNN